MAARCAALDVTGGARHDGQLEVPSLAGTRHRRCLDAGVTQFKTPAVETPAAAPAAAAPGGGPLGTEAQPAPIPLEIKLPEQEGVYDLVLEASERTALRWSKSISERRVQIVVLAEHAPAACRAIPPAGTS